MTKRFLALSFFLIVAAVGMAQHKLTLEADAQFEGENYYTAIELYKKAFSKEKDKAKKVEILYKIGRGYHLMEDLKQAEVWYKKAIKANYDNPEVYLYLAQVKEAEGRYDEAIVDYQKYLEFKPNDPIAKRGVEECKLAQEWMDNPTEHIITNEALLNSKFEDFSPTYADKKYNALIFTSTREGSTGDQLDSRTGQNFSDLYYSKRDRKGKWSVPVKLNETINTEANEGSACLNRKRNTIYFTRCGVDKHKAMGCAIYYAPKMGQKWGEAVQIHINDSATIGHPAIAPDDSYLIFASDMEGGQGGKDLWYITYDKKSKTWDTVPKNLGPEINTPLDEIFPFVRADGTLYFASNGHYGMGELDIFKAEKIGDMQWGNVENLKYPINSPANDFGIIFEGNRERGFFTSSRDGGRGSDDIYSFYIPPRVYVIQGTVKDVDTNEPIPGATVTLKGSDGTVVEVKTDELGFYKFDNKEGSKERIVLEGVTYEIVVSAPDYLVGKGKESTVGVEESTTFVHDFGLQSIRKDEIRFPEVLYDLDKWELRPESKDSLNFLYQVLIDNPTIVIELAAHTDSRGSAEYNLELSQKRAESCVNYLISKGIDPERLVPKGYGETQLIFSDEDIAKLETEEEREAAHQKNRRTVFRVLRTDFVPKNKPAEEGAQEEKGE